jgi:hypothetical protein
MDLSQELIARLRVMAGQGATVKMMVTEIRNHVKTDDGLSLAADAYFWKAFLLPLGEIRDIEGSACLGGKAYTDEQIDRLMLPRIANTRHLWERV